MIPSRLESPSVNNSADARKRQAEIIKQEWSRGVPPNTAEALAGHPDLRADHSVCMDLAYEEYCLLCERGEPPDVETFCARFPSCQTSLLKMLRFHQFISKASLPLDCPPRCGSAPEPTCPYPEPGEQVGDFTLLRELGRGGFARVYLATESSLGDRPVVVKVSQERSREARTVGRLIHPHIVPILSAHVESNGLTVVCMPYLGNATLDHVLRGLFIRGGKTPAPRHASALLDALNRTRHSEDPDLEMAPPPSWLEQGRYTDAVLHLAEQIAGALAFLHRQGICHRDLKPSNVLLTQDGRALLLDFNLATDSAIRPDSVGGTVPCMAPEQVRAWVDHDCNVVVDERADVFSLGVMVYELLSGQHPFGPIPPRRNMHELARLMQQRHQHGCRPLRKLCPRLPRPIAGLIERCLELEPDHRPRNAGEVASTLRSYFQRQQQQRRRGKHSLLVGGCLILLTLAFVGGSLSLPWWGPSDAESLFRAGRAEMAQERWATALPLFEKALDAQKAETASEPMGQPGVKPDHRQQRQGATLACLAYCYSKQKQHDAACSRASEALECGFRPAAVFNNRAYSYLQLHLLSEAQDDLEEALRLEPDLAAAHRSWAYLAFCYRNEELTRTVDAASLARVEKVLQGEPQDPWVYQYAARLYALAARDDAARRLEYRDRAIACLREALAKGAKSSILDERPLGTLTGHPGFLDLRAIPAAQKGAVQSSPSLVDPLAPAERL